MKRNGKRYVLFEDGDGKKWLASSIVVQIIADQYDIPPDNKTFTADQLAEAIEMDKAEGDFVQLIGGDHRVVG
jgi:hypothetical protein